MGDFVQKSAWLVLQNGTVFKGKAAGKIGTATGEICFNTGMTGYQEVFTDPSYYGQIMVTTNAHIGNYGTKSEDAESETVQISALICKNFTNEYSRKVADSNIQDFMEKNGIVCIYELDTRAIVREIRDLGAMNCIISSEIDDISVLKEMLNKVPSMEGLELASKVSTREPYYIGDPHAPYRIAVMDYGTKRNILRCFVERSCYLKVFPAHTTFAEMADFQADGYFLSNGPGDPAAMDYTIDTVKAMIQSNKPLFGICLGHQLLALAMNVKTYKMHHGHRGINHPVKNIISGKCEITSQNHGFAVDSESIQNRQDLEITHINLNDNSLEGIRIKDKPAFSVQYHPESAPGPHDSRYLFDQFVSFIQQSKNN